VHLGVGRRAPEGRGQVAPRAPRVEGQPRVVALDDPQSVAQRGEVNVLEWHEGIRQGERLRVRALLEEPVKLRAHRALCRLPFGGAGAERFG
jgi:hypothetical protein